jgi:hypothetical protein
MNPFAGQLSPTTFHPEAIYEFKVSVSDNSQEDFSYRFNFSEAGTDGVQQFELRRIEGVVLKSGQEGRLLAAGHTNQTVTFSEGSRVWASISADPFFGNGVGLGEWTPSLTRILTSNILCGLNTALIV